MKRFFFVSALASVSAAILSICLSASYWIAGIIALIIILAGLLVRFVLFKKYYVSLIAFAVIFLIFFGYSEVYSQISRNNLQMLDGKTCQINASIIDEPEDHGSYFTYYVKTSYVGLKDAPQAIKLVLYTSESIDAQVFDEIKGNIKFSDAFDSMHNNYYADGYFVSAGANHITAFSTSVKPIRATFINIKNDIKQLFKRNLPRDISGIPLAILTGDKTEISDEFYSDVRFTGMAHVMAVSGLHISIICSSVVSLLLRLKLNKKFSYFIGFIIVLLLAAIAGFSGSVMRAAIMYAVIVLAKLFVRTPDTLNSLGIAVTLLMFLTPYNIYSVSFILSTLGTLGIVVLMPLLKDKIDGLFKNPNFITKFIIYHIDSFAVSLCASVMIMPFSLFTFGYVSIISPIINVILTIPVYLLLMFIVLSVIFCKIPFVSDILFYIVNVLSIFFKSIISFFADFKNTGFFIDDIFLYVLASALIVCFILVYFLRKRKVAKILISAFAFIFVLASLIGQGYVNTNKTEVYIVDSDKPCIVLARGSHAAIIGMGESDRANRNVEYIIDSNYLDVDLFVLPTEEENTISQAKRFLSENQVKCFVSPYSGCFKNSDAIIEGFDATLWGNIEITSYEAKFGNNILINIDNNSFLLESHPDKNLSADIILTSKPEESFRFHGKYPKYFLFNELEEAIDSSHELTLKGAETAITNKFGSVNIIKNDGSVLKFRRK